MPFLSLCCGSSHSSKRSEAEAEVRRARIVPILDPSVYNHRDYQPRSSNDLPPPRYEDVTSSVSLHSVPILMVDDKDSNTLRVVEVGTDTPTHDTRRLNLRPQPTGDEANTTQFEGSDRSSIISIPSTQVTGLGSSYTGTTTLRGDMTGRTSRDDGSRRGSVRLSETGTLRDESESRPPSYYASSLQRLSRSPSPGSGSDGKIECGGIPL